MRDRRRGSQWGRVCSDCGKNGHKAGQCASEEAFRARLAAEVARLAEAKAAEAKAETDKGGG